MKNKIIAGVLALFFGGLGIHWFYLDETTKGVTYLATTIIGFILSFIIIGFIPLIVIGLLALIDALKFLLMSDEEFNAKYNKSING